MFPVIAVIALLFGFIAGMVAYSKIPKTSVFVVFFIFGAMFPVLGIIIAALVKPETAERS
jgi:small basic protein